MELIPPRKVNSLFRGCWLKGALLLLIIRAEVHLYEESMYLLPLTAKSS